MRGKLPSLRGVLGLLLAVPAAAAPFRVTRDIAYLGPGLPQRLDLYLPATATPGGGPAVVFLHGGGWVKGDKSGLRDRRIASELASAGYAVASVDYRLGAKVWPGNLEDCRNAVRFLRVRAAQDGINPNRIAVMGASAGGHLALLVAFGGVRAASAEPAVFPGVSDSVRAVVDFYGITDLTTRRRSLADGTPTSRWMDSYAGDMLGVSLERDPAAWRDASPVFHIQPSSPPVLIVHGLSDSTVDYPQAIELADDLAARGVEHQLVLLKGVGHMFDLETWRGKPLPADVRSLVLDFLRRHLSTDVR